MAIRPPVIIGIDYAGIVSAVGESVTKFKPGDSVYGFTSKGQTAAEYLLLSSSHLFSIAKVPSNLSFEESASLPVSAHTAIIALLRIEKEIPGGLKGKTGLVPAGLGGIGSLLLQLLKPVFGAGKVITTLSTAKVPRLARLIGEGLVDQIVDYTKEDVISEVGRQSVDVLLDRIFLSMTYLPLMKPGAGVELAFMGKSGDTLAKDWPELPWYLKTLVNGVDSVFKWRARRWGVKYDHARTYFTNETVEAIDRWATEGKLKPIIGGIAEMDDLETLKKFFDIVGSGKGAVGKYVIKIP